MPPAPRIALFTRFPTPGLAKTRLIPLVGAEGAAAIHRRLVERTLATLRKTGLPFELRVTGAPRAAFAAWLGADVPCVDQGDGDLGARMARVAAPVILLGADVPGLTHHHLADAAAALATANTVIGPATDGGYYLLGFRTAVPFVFEDMVWGTDTVFAETMRRFALHGETPVRLAALDDLDRPEDLQRWPDLMA